MKPFFSHLAEATLAHVIATVLISIAGATLTVLAAGGIGLYLNPTFGFPLFAVLLVGAGSLLIYFLLLIRLRAKRPVFDSIDSEYEFLEREYSMDFKSRTEAHYTRKYTIRALKNDVGVVREAYCWTGSDPVNISVTEGGALVANTGTRGPFQLFEVHLDSPLKKGETATVGISFELEDKQKKAKPFLSAVISEPTQLLRLRVRVYAGGWNVDAVGEESPSPTSRKNVSATKKRFDEDGRISWEVRKPRLMHTYELRWKGPQWQ